MLLIIVRLLYAVTCAGLIAAFVHSSAAMKVDAPERPQLIAENPVPSFFILLAITQAAIIIDLLVRRKRLDVISSLGFGLLIGAFVSSLLSAALSPSVPPSYHQIVNMTMFAAFSYISISFLIQTKDDFRFVIPYVEFSREVKGGIPLVLDSSALIDGRIADIVETNVFDSEILVPDFVLAEVQEIADSGDKNRRMRGRRGLDVVTKLQQNPKLDVRMFDSKGKGIEGATVDQLLVSMCKVIGGRVVTNDFNLNKVASVQGVDVINLNDVANALRPRYLHGDMLRIRVIREGESIGQGVGYLDDGTMVVSEQASHLVGKEIDCIVTSTLQNSAGRMIFGRLAGSPTPPPK